MKNATELADQLSDRGLVKLDGFIAHEDIAKAREAVFTLAREHGLLADGVWDKSHSRFGLPKPFRAQLNSLHRMHTFPPLFADDLLALAGQLVGAKVAPIAPRHQILFTLPSQDEWVIPHDVWHLDLPRLGENKSPGLQAFTFLDDVGPQGGATLVVAGSHRLLNHAGHLPSKEVKQLLMRESYFRHLFDRERPASSQPEDFVGQVGDVSLEVVELTGNAGDVYLMDLRMFHTPAPNSSDTARMMVTCRMPRATIAEKVGQIV